MSPLSVVFRLWAALKPLWRLPLPVYSLWAVRSLVCLVGLLYHTVYVVHGMEHRALCLVASTLPTELNPQLLVFSLLSGETLW